jgi:hypothetical protein
LTQINIFCGPWCLVYLSRVDIVHKILNLNI